MLQQLSSEIREMFIEQEVRSGYKFPSSLSSFHI